MDNDKEIATIPFFTHESDMARAGVCNKRLVVALIIAILALLLSIGALLVNNYIWLEHVETIKAQTSATD